MQTKLSLPLLAMAAGLLSLGSCGNSGNQREQLVEKLERQETQGFYVATLSGINTSVAGHTTGTGVFKIEGDEVEAELRVEDAPAQVVHMQFVRSGTACPDASADRNNDGVIDIAEAENFSGKIFIPLDSNINSQLEGSNYPVARSTGRYYYSEAASLTNMLADLYSPDDNLHDSTLKLEAGQELNLSGRVVMIHGISGDSTLPETVASNDGKPVQASLPIACGILSRVSSSDPIITSTGGKN